MDNRSRELIRQQLIAVYPASTSWKARVLKMSDGQLYAIQQKFKKSGHLK